MYEGVGGKIVLGKNGYEVDKKGVVEAPESCKEFLMSAGWKVVAEEKKVEKKKKIKIEKKVEEADKKKKRFIRSKE